MVHIHSEGGKQRNELSISSTHRFHLFNPSIQSLSPPTLSPITMSPSIKNSDNTSEIEFAGGREFEVAAALEHVTDPALSPKNLHADQKVSSSSTEKKNNNKRYNINMPLLVINYACLFVGSLSSSLLSKYYFNHNGSSRWVSTWVQTAGFPLLIFPICLPYVLKLTKRIPFTDFTPRILCLSVSIGVMLGFNNLFFSWGNSYLPVSTSALLLSTQLLFTLLFSVIIVKQKINFSNVNCVILLTLSAVLLGLDSSHERPKGLTKKNYFVGFFCTIGAGLMFSLYLPLMERVYEKVKCYQMVMEMQIIMEATATALAIIGMTMDGGFSEMKVESETRFDKGSRVYWVTVMGNVVTWQLCFMGTAGMVFLTSSLTGGVCMTFLLSMNVLGGVVVYKDAFGGVKAVSTFLCVWGFCSYVYGIYKHGNDQKMGEYKTVKTSPTRDKDCHCNHHSSSSEMVDIVTH